VKFILSIKNLLISSSAFLTKIIIVESNVEESNTVSYSGRSVAKNTIYNLLGYGIPLVLALGLIPPLIKNLGNERFGLLNLSWIVVGYFSFLDFGIGKALTKIIAEKIGLNQNDQIPSLFWTSILLMFSVSVLVAIVATFFMPYLVNVFHISKNMHDETLASFYALAVSIPIVSTMAGLRGFLEAYQKFGIINSIRIFLGIFTFLGPLLVLIVTNSLFWIVVFLVVIRLFVWVFYLLQCFKINRNIKNEFKFEFNSIKPVLRFSFWITLANIIGPIILYSDRVIIGALITAAAITFYATPYEVVTKLMLIPTSLVGVLFPIFSASFFTNPELSKRYLIQGIKLIFLIIYPIVFLIVMFSFEGMELWLGENFAQNSSIILQYLAIGIMMNALSIIPNNFFQGVGKPRIPTLINISEFPIYIIVMWFSVKTYGIKGAAIAYMAMAAFDAILMYIAAYKLFSIKFESRYSLILILLFLIILVIPFLISGLLLKTIVASIFLLSFVLITWNYLLASEEKLFIISKLKLRF
jgi:O-antigen/teichoic acid export membrane protein